MPEILVAVAIIGILATVFVSRLDPSSRLKKTRDSQRKANVKVIQAALEVYRSDLGSYPNPNSNSVKICANGTLCDSTSGTTYLQNVPTDPNTGGNYYYCTSSNAATCGASNGGYVIYGCLENSAEPLGTEVIVSPPAGVTMSPACPVTSPTRYLKVTNP